LRYMDVNPAIRKLFGVPTSEIIGRRHEDLFGKEGSKHTREADSRVLEGATIEGEQTRTIHGIPRTFLYTKTPLRDGSGEIIGIVSISRDVTERKRLEFSCAMTQEYPSKAMRSTLKSAILAGKGATTVLLTGESGSGKDYLARYIHDHSDRATGPYFSVNCAAISEGLAESELFGHERGSFTGAVGRKRGLLELAEGGTLLLNEIGELSLPLQSKLLTSWIPKITQWAAKRIQSMRDSLRLQTETRREVEEQSEKTFLPPQRDVIKFPRSEGEDILFLCKRFYQNSPLKWKSSIPTIDDSTMRRWNNWTGNVRTAMERA
jgi:PAS domain S-box-containing protein